MAAGRAEWEQMQQRGLRSVLVRGAARHGLLMGTAVVALLELLAGDGLTRERFTSGAFLGRAAVCYALFAISGAISAYARWRSAEALFADENMGV